MHAYVSVTQTLWGNFMSSPAELISTFLTSITGGVTGWDLKIGKMVTTPNQIVALFDSGGQNPSPRWLLDYPTFQARIRGEKSDYAGAYTKARAVKDALLGVDSQDIGSERLVNIICMGDIGFMGYDENDRPEFVVNFRAIIEPSSGTHRDPL